MIGVGSTGAGGNGGTEAGGSGGTNAGGSGGGTNVGGVQHAICSQPFPDVAPALPQVNMTAEGRPKFDLWRDIESCDPELVCQKDSDCGGGFGKCLIGESGGKGVCTSADFDIWCDGEGEAIGFGDGACFACSPAEVHAAACCEEVSGFDCRAWPFDADSAPGMLCAVHEDCEPGLVCAESKGSGYGICQCPGTSGVGPADTCF
jgi:hypothetical protein